MRFGIQRVKPRSVEIQGGSATLRVLLPGSPPPVFQPSGKRFAQSGRALALPPDQHHTADQQPHPDEARQIDRPLRSGRAGPRHCRGRSGSGARTHRPADRAAAVQTGSADRDTSATAGRTPAEPPRRAVDRSPEGGAGCPGGRMIPRAQPKAAPSCGAQSQSRIAAKVATAAAVRRASASGSSAKSSSRARKAAHIAPVRGP